MTLFSFRFFLFRFNTLPSFGREARTLYLKVLPGQEFVRNRRTQLPENG